MTNPKNNLVASKYSKTRQIKNLEQVLEKEEKKIGETYFWNQVINWSNSSEKNEDELSDVIQKIIKYPSFSKLIQKAKAKGRGKMTNKMPSGKNKWFKNIF